MWTLRAGGADDADGRRTLEILSAHSKADAARTFRIHAVRLIAVLAV